MVAQVGSIEQRYPPNRKEEGNLAPRAPELAQRATRHMKRAETIQEQAHLDPFFRASNEAIDNRASRGVGLQHIGFDVDALLGAVDQRHQVCESILAAVMKLEGVATGDPVRPEMGGGLCHLGLRRHRRGWLGRREDDWRLGSSDTPDLATAEKPEQRYPD